ncbi:7TM diverse intracellular signaling domain-containing protein [Nubsella zeaxanthinifaciens]|uniref:7TM diverse intracellular signaling domain-containing protein n=1 Tax=Nubsella zeaxanthinifaciens TaxID=392412 RepID=UPI003D0435D0
MPVLTNIFKKDTLQKLIGKLLLLFVFLVSQQICASAQRVLEVDSSTEQHIFSFADIQWIKEQGKELSITEVSSTAYNKLFSPSLKSTPVNKDLGTAYWYRIKVRANQKIDKNFLLEFFDQTIDSITAYVPNENNGFNRLNLGDSHHFSSRFVHHKNFEIPITLPVWKDQTYYFRIKSSQPADVIIVLRSVNWFIEYALNEYFTFGVFYGMILVFSFYNLIMYIYLRQIQYLFYVGYNMSIGLYEMCVDGIAYQYLWPNSPAWNQTAYAVAICSMSVFAMLFTLKLLHVKTKAPGLYKLLNALIAVRILTFFCMYFWKQEWFTYRFIESIPLTAAFFTGIWIYKKGYRPARYFVIGYSFLFAGFLLKFLIMLGLSWLNFSVISYYSLTICFILEMVFLSLAIGDKVRLFKRKKDKAQQAMIKQMRDNEKLKDAINRKLEKKVELRTREVTEQAEIIEQQNKRLLESNNLLKEQANEISRINALLEQDNKELKVGIESVTRARIMSADVDFTEFSKIYPDKDSCFKFLAELKWGEGYHCKKCNTSKYIEGHTPYSRRCNSCGYEESVLIDTIFQNSRIPINKLFYLVFLIYSSKGRISSHKLAQVLEIRQNTCWTYSVKIKKMMNDRKNELKKAGEQGWSKLVLE